MESKTKKKDFLYFLYHNAFGRMILKVLKARWISKLVGVFMNSCLSKPLIIPFIRKNNIKIEEFECDNFTCFNDCFTRKIKDGLRPIDMDAKSFISPCDGLLSVYPIKDGLVLPVKQSKYSIPSLLKDEKLAKKYQDGICLVFRLCVNHYHRYCYLDDGKKSKNIFIPGVLHTVRPIALESTPVFIENCREYTVMNTKNFGNVTQIEVGALLVGKIKNHEEEAVIEKGQEKGMFLFGGSTIIVLLEKDKVRIPKKYFDTTNEGKEIDVKMGEKIGTRI